MKTRWDTPGRWTYGVLFTVALPILLVWWAVSTADAVALPTIPFAPAGAAVLLAGAAIMAAGIAALWRFGQGLPMSPFPPPTYVARGIYRLVPHPIYVGFVLACVGAAVWTRSASGTWLVTPVVALGCAALVLGFERHDLRRRFGVDALRRPLLALPPASDERPTGWDRASVIVLVLLPWTVVYEAVTLLGVPRDAVEALLPFERSWPVWQWTEAVYASVYLFVPAAVFAVTRRAALRRMAVTALIATAVITLIYLAVPVVSPPRPFVATTFLGRMLHLEHAMSGAPAAFPAFHVVWAGIAAEAWASRSRIAGALAWSWAALIAVSCLTTGMHAVLDVAAAVPVFLVLRRMDIVWEGLRRVTERLANSWREWRLGPVRVINHGLYAALGGAIAFLIAAGAVGPEALWQVAVIHVAGLLGAGLWAQTLEGSPRLSRPFGYYGSVLGAVAAALVMGWMGGNAMLLLAALALEAPWLQAIGRARCLVQGCCHGSPAPERVGIRYLRDRSRVCALGDLRGVPLHPTPLYSMLSNVVTGILLARLWALGAALSIVGGSYLILAGASRFVEESYRGEPQTPVLGGLRLYQWLAILSFVAGAVVTALPAGAAPAWRLMPDAGVLAAALGFGVLCGFALGVDFPGSARRFARLAAP